MSSLSKEIASTLSYRLYNNDDQNAILELWEKYSGWGAITLEQFTDWYLNTPFGPCMVVVAEDEQYGIVGQIIFVPSKAYIDGKEINAYRVMAPIVNKDFRALNIKDFNHPAYAMFRYGLKEAKDRDHPFIYFLPSIGWLSLVRTFPKYGLPKANLSIHNCLQVDITAGFANTESNQYYIKPGNVNEEYDELWTSSMTALRPDCSVVKKSVWLKWKRKDQIVFEMRHQGDQQLKGYIIIKKSAALVLDILAPGIEEMALLIQLLIQYLHTNKVENNGVQFSCLKFMQTATVDKILRFIPHYTIDFRFAAVNFSLDEKSLENKQWFIMPDD